MKKPALKNIILKEPKAKTSRMQVGRKRALESQQQHYRRMRLSNFGRSSILFAATILSFSVIALLITDKLFRPNEFVIDNIEIKGDLKHVNPLAIKEIAEQNEIGNFFSVELLAIKKSVEESGWIRAVDVRRIWPNTLTIEVQEHKPAMKWRTNKWLNAYGEVIDVNRANSQDTVTLYGEDKDSRLIMKQAVKWQHDLSKLGLNLVVLKLSGSHAWTMTINRPASVNRESDKFELFIGREQITERFNRFKYMYEHLFNSPLIQIERIDTRYPNGIAAKTVEISKPQAHKERAATTSAKTNAINSVRRET